MGTDIFAVHMFTTQGKFGFAYATLATISVSMTIQLMVVLGQNSRKKKSFILRESLIVISCLKPAVDAYR